MSRILISSMVLAILVGNSLIGCAQTPSPTPTPPLAKPPATQAPAAATAAPKTAAETPGAPKPTAAPAATAPAKATPAPESKPASVAPAKPLSPAVPVKVGVMNITPDAGIYIALERGYFKEEGLDVQLVGVVSGAEVIPPLATGELSFGTGSVNPGFFNAVARGLDLKIVADKSKMLPQMTGAGLIVRKDLHDSGQLKETSQLKGKNIALNLKATTSEMYIERILAKGGLKLNDVNLVEMPFPDTVPALANKAVDAAWVVEPFVTIPIERGLAKLLFPGWEVYPDHFTSVVMISPVFAKDQPEASKRFITAFLRGIRDHYNAVAKKTAPLDPIVGYLAKYTAVKDPEMLKRLLPDVGDPNGYIKAEFLADDQEYYFQKGYVKDKVDPSKLVDFQYVEYALQRLGRMD